jgi:hypothetical protein
MVPFQSSLEEDRALRAAPSPTSGVVFLSDIARYFWSVRNQREPLGIHGMSQSAMNNCGSANKPLMLYALPTCL